MPRKKLTEAQKKARAKNKRKLKLYGSCPKTSMFKKYKSSSTKGSQKAPYPLFASIAGFPAVKTVNLPYHMEFTTSSAGITYNTFYTNDVYGPDATSSGHQPRGHDQYVQFYKYYRVNKCVFTAMFFWEETPSQSHTVGIYVDQNNTFAYTNTNDLFEKIGFQRCKTLGSDRTSRVIVKCAIPIKQLTSGALADQRTAFGSRPTLLGPYVHVWTVPNNTSALTYGAVRVHVSIILNVTMFEPLDIAGS